MSTTAGVGTSEYVEVNSSSVWAILLGLASSLALVDPYLLLIPLLAIVFSLVALRQINNSNGTQTGRWLAWLGMALAVGFGSFVLSRMAAQARQDARDRDTVMSLVVQLSDHLKASRFEAAYALFSPQFRERVPFDQGQINFSSQVRLLANNAVYGQLQSIESNGIVEFYDAGADQDFRSAASRLLMKVEKSPDPIPQDAQFRRHEGVWYIENIPALFPPPDRRQ